MRIRVHVIHRDPGSPASREIVSYLKGFGVEGIDSVRRVRLVFLEAGPSLEELEAFAEKVLLDPVVESVFIYPDDSPPVIEGSWVEIGYLPGVMDPEAITISRAFREFFRQDPVAVFTGVRYEFPPLDKGVLNAVLSQLYNPLIQIGVINDFLHPFHQRSPGYEFSLREVELLEKGDEELLQISKDWMLSLNLREMKAVQEHYRKLGRNPTDVELETIAQTWSEHCQHKTFKSPILYREVSEEGDVVTEERISSLFKDYIMKATKELDKPWCLSVFKDNAGVVEFDSDWAVCFKVETHNHPSALEPFGGANTGLGGVIRDVLGCGLGAKPIANTDVFCFAPPDTKEVPEGVIHPRRMMREVVAGVRDYGNKMGIPTVNGAIFFDPDFCANPLVYCGTVGLMPKGAVEKEIRPGDKIVLIGGRTGRDGIHGATFSSAELTEESQYSCASAVQIGNPIEEKKFADVLLKIRDKGWYRAITDCGAGGLSSAVGEMARDVGAVVYLEKVPLKYSGLSYTEIWISESQERMVLAVKPEYLEDVVSAFAEEDVLATCIGEFTGDRRLRLYYDGALVMEMDVDFLHGGLPLEEKLAVWTWVKKEEPVPDVEDPSKTFRQVLSSYNIASKEWVIRQYDHEVQGRSALKPLCGPRQVAPSDSAVIRGHLHSKKGIALGCGINPWYGRIDPYWMAGACIDEAIRQIVAVGGNPDRISILDNFCWGNPDKPDRLGGLVRASKGCYDFALGFGVPFISGKDSLYNEFLKGNESIPIPGTLLISGMGMIDDISKVVSPYLKRRDTLLYVVGLTRDELGGSAFLNLFGVLGNSVPRTDVSLARELYKRLHLAVREGIVLACHDISDGGIGVALAEMCIGGGIGAELFLNNVPFEGDRRSNEVVFYSESQSRFLVEIDRKHKGRFEKLFEGLPCELVGRTSEGKSFVVYGLEGEEYIVEDVKNLERVWRSRFRW